MVDLWKVGRLDGEARFMARTRSRASAVAMSSLVSLFLGGGSWSSSVRRASGGVRTLNSSLLLTDVDEVAAGDADECRRVDGEDRVGRAGRGPHLVVVQQVGVDVGGQP